MLAVRIICFYLGQSTAKEITFPIPKHVFDKWDTMSMFEKYPYLTDQEDRQNKYNEFTRHSDGKVEIEFKLFYENLNEFQTTSHILHFWQYCDINTDNSINFDEYIYCRGEFDQNGNRYYFNEYEFAEKILLDEMQQLINDEENLKMQENYIYDENGIIID